MNDLTEVTQHVSDLRREAERAALRHRLQTVAKWERRARRAGDRARQAAEKLG